MPQGDFILVAESFSGYIAYKIALLNLPNLISIVFVASFLEPPKPLLLKVTSFLPMRLIFSLPLPKFIIKQFLLGKNASDDLMHLVRTSIKKVKPEVLAYRLSLMNNIVADTPIALNVTYLQASNDKLVAKRCFNKFQQLFRQVNLQQIKGSHFLLQVQPKLCALIAEKAFVKS